MKFSIQLKEYTEQSHQKLEKVLVKKLKAISSIPEYVEILEKFYGYIRPVEENINKYISSAILPDYNERRKAEAIRIDIHDLGGDITQVRLSETLPRIDNLYRALGALYVLEGSTLGGQIISKMLSSSLKLEGSGLRYFSGYGESTKEKWQKFKDLLDNGISTPQEQKDILISADETFMKFESWLEHYE